MGNNWKITDTLTKVFADEVPDGQGSMIATTMNEPRFDLTGRFP